MSIKTMEPGIYFGLPEEEYHAAFALSASGIKHMKMSTLDFWMRSPLNPEPPDESMTDSFAKTLGSAYHKRIVEGRALFDTLYAPEIDKDDYPNALYTVEDLKDALAKRDQKSKGKKADLIEQLLGADPSAQIWDVIAESYRDQHDGKIFLPQKYMANIEIAAAMIERDPVLCKAFSGGQPEVSIFWNAEIELPDQSKFIVPMKRRLDYLKGKAIVELKTFGNPNERPIDRAIATAFASRRYHIDAAVSHEACAQIAGLIKAERVFGQCVPELLEALAKNEDKTFLFVFRSTGLAPVGRGRVFPTSSNMFSIGEIEIRAAKEKFAACSKAFAEGEPWVDSAPITAFDDSEIPSYAAE